MGALPLPLNLLIMKKNIISFGICFLFIGSGLSAQQDSVWTLEACINYALEQNITVRKTVLSNQSLAYQASQLKASRYPSVGATLGQSFNWNRSDGIDSGAGSIVSSNGSNYGVNAQVNLFNSFRLSNQIKQSVMDVEGGKYNLEATKESISLSILNAFLQVLYAQEQVKNSEKQIESTSGQLNLALERLNLQVISMTDYLQVKSQLASEKLILANANSQLAIARVNLMQFMELPVTDGFVIAQPNLDVSLNQNRIADVRGVYSTALSIKPQIKYAAINKEIAALDEKIARSGYYPSISANASLNSAFSGKSYDPYFDQLDLSSRAAVGFTLAIPIYQNKQVKTSVAIAKIGYQQAELSETDTKNQLRKNIEQASLDVTSAQIEYEASMEKYQATLESSNLSDEKFTQGIINSVDYLVTKTNLIVAESQFLQSKYNLIFSYKILDFYQGIPLSL
jgi:outer membrane protein